MSRSGHEPVQPMHPQIASTSGIPGPATSNLNQSPGGSHKDAPAVPEKGNLKRKKGKQKAISSPATNTPNQRPGPDGDHEDSDSDAAAEPKKRIRVNKGTRVTYTDPWTGDTGKRAYILKPNGRLNPV